MLGIILGVLKILGILLLLLLIIILMLGICVLFYPVSYCLQGEIKDEIRGKVIIRWLFGLVRFRGIYQENTGFLYRIYLVFFKIYPKEEKVRKEKKKKKKIKKIETGANEKKVSSKEKKSDDKKKKEINVMETDTMEDKKMPSVMSPNGSAKNISQIQDAEKELGFFKRIGQLFHGIVERIDGIVKKIKKMWQNIKKALSSVEGFFDFIQSKEFRDTLSFLNEQRKYLFRKIAPKKCMIEAKYGTGDPGTTGEILAALSVVRTFLPGRWRIYPDFDNVLLEASGCVKGKIPLYVIVLLVYRCYQNDMIKEIYKKFE